MRSTESPKVPTEFDSLLKTAFSSLRHSPMEYIHIESGMKDTAQAGGHDLNKVHILDTGSYPREPTSLIAYTFCDARIHSIIVFGGRDQKRSH